MMRQAALAEARAWIGTPYRHQAACRGMGTDCLGLVRGIWRALYGAEPEIPPPYTPDWAERSGGETLLQAAQHHMVELEAGTALPGDMLVFRPCRRGMARHCAILAAPDRIIHAYWGRAVCETALSPWWRARLAGEFRFPDMPERETEVVNG